MTANSEPARDAQHDTTSTDWVRDHHWMICQMDPRDDDIGIIASFLSHAHKFGGLSPRQQKWGVNILRRVRAEAGL